MKKIWAGGARVPRTPSGSATEYESTLTYFSPVRKKILKSNIKHLFLNKLVLQENINNIQVFSVKLCTLRIKRVKPFLHRCLKYQAV